MLTSCLSLQEGKPLVRIEESLDVHEVNARPRDLRPSGENLMEARISYCHGYRNHREFLASLAAMPEVKELRREEKGRGHRRSLTSGE
jgi:hypothetical protein